MTETAKKEKVIDGLLHCLQSYASYEKNCGDCRYYSDKKCIGKLKNDAIALLKAQPEIVHCGECKHWGKPLDYENAIDVAYCDIFSKTSAFTSGFYCARGERKGDE